jgi:hypothetical protein
LILVYHTYQNPVYFKISPNGHNICVSVILALRRLRQKVHKFEVSMGYIANPK